MELNRNCPICYSPTGIVIHHTRFVTFDNSPFPAAYDVVSCSHCGFIFADLKSNQSTFDSYYKLDSKYEDNTTSTSGGVTPWDQQRLSETARIIADIVVSPKAKIVDIGCGNGGLLEALKEAGFSNLIGVDPSLICTRNVNKIGGIIGFQGSLSQLPSQLESCDVVILSHVLEHVYDFKSAFSNIHRILSHDGLVYAETPDAMNYRNFNASPLQEFNHEHINHFSRQCLRNLLVSNDFIPLIEAPRIIQSARDKPYPAIYIIAKKSAIGFASPSSIIPDVELIHSIREYIDDSNRMIQEYEDVIESILENNDRIVVWGVGALALKLLVYTSLSKPKIECFIDGNPINQGKTIDGIAVKPPQSIHQLSEIPILITTTLHAQEIIAQINLMGVKNQVYSI